MKRRRRGSWIPNDPRPLFYLIAMLLCVTAFWAVVGVIVTVIVSFYASDTVGAYTYG